MDERTRNRLIAKESGLTLGQVESYVLDYEPQPDGSWVVYFASEVDRDPEVASSLPASRTIHISKEVVEGYERGNG